MSRERFTGPGSTKYLELIQLEVEAQAIDDLGIGILLNLHAHRIAFAAVVEFGADAFEQAARLFFLKVEVAVAGDAKGRGGEDLVSAIHAGCVALDKIVEEKEVRGAALGGNGHEARQGAGNSDYAENQAASLALAAQQQGEAESLVEHAGKGVGGIDGDGREERIDLALVKGGGVGAAFVGQILPAQYANAAGAKLRQQEFVPAAVLLGDKKLQVFFDGGQRLLGGQAVESGFPVAILNALQDAGEADFDEFVQVAGGNGQKLDPFEQGVTGIFCFFQHAAIEAQP